MPRARNSKSTINLLVLLDLVISHSYSHSLAADASVIDSLGLEVGELSRTGYVAMERHLGIDLDLRRFVWYVPIGHNSYIFRFKDSVASEVGAGISWSSLLVCTTVNRCAGSSSRHSSRRLWAPATTTGWECFDMRGDTGLPLLLV